MKFINTDIEGVFIIEPQIFHDPRGYFFESYNEEKFFKNGIKSKFVQDNQSMSVYGVIRGLHCQTGKHSQAKLVRVLSGKVLDVAVDIRRNSPTFGKHVAVELSDSNHRQLYIPREFLHGFSVLSEVAIFAYKVDNLYCKESEFGIAYNDPDVGIDWKIPKNAIITSEKDRQANRLKDILQNELKDS